MSNIIEQLKNQTIIHVAFILIVGILVYTIVDKVFQKYIKANSINVVYMSAISKGIIVVITSFTIANQFAITSKVLAVLLASSGLIVAVFGFAAQESLSNIINGFFISVFKPFEIGDRVTLINAGITGIVTDITLRHTVIDTYINTSIVVPNSVMNKDIIENAHLKDKRGVSFLDVTISYKSDVRLAISIIKQSINENELVLKDEHVWVYVRDMDNKGVHLRAKVWTLNVDDNFIACSDIRITLKEKFEHAGIELPYN